jgi:surface antigen
VSPTPFLFQEIRMKLLYPSLLFPSLLVITLSVALGACTATQGPQEQSGMVIGSLLGGVLGAQVGRGDGRTVATIVGAMIGASVGGNVGRSMDENDRLKTAYALESVRTSVPSRWVNPDTRNQYTVTPTRTYEAPTGPCREYTVQAVVRGVPDTVYGTACRQPDGSWKAVN